jgi:hypothetical protein
MHRSETKIETWVIFFCDKAKNKPNPLKNMHKIKLRICKTILSLQLAPFVE